MAKTNTVLGSKIVVTYAPFGVPAANRYYLLCGQLAESIRFAARLASLAYFIFHVVLARSDKQVVPIATGRIIALMAYRVVAWINTPMKKKCESMSLHANSRIASRRKSAISAGVNCFLVRPAIIWIASLNGLQKLFNFLFSELERNEFYVRFHALTPLVGPTVVGHAPGC